MRYKKFKRKVNINGTSVEKYVAKLHLESSVDLDEICKKIEIMSAASKADVLLILKSLEQVIKVYLAQGHSVKLGMLGSFYPVMNAKSVDDSKDITPETITRVSCKFTPSKELREELGNTSLKLLDDRIYTPRQRNESSGSSIKKRKKTYKR